ncbi:MAG: DNA polymerase III subunit alpha [Saprospiraceae bacterium]|nr:DNA polymerase III subunit alpha [Saprospiraceae bacterium]
MKFSHLHCHTQFSLLDGAASIPKLFKKAAADGMPAVAITDHGNMFGVFEFVAEAAKNGNAVKPIVGCEFYLVEDRTQKTFSKDRKDKRFHQLFLAKNTEGYRNLTKMCSLGFMEGMYSKYPRIDKQLVEKYHKGLIATTCCLGASVPQAILMKGEDAGRKEFEWWLNMFGEDYYIELQRHNLREQILVNEVLLRFAKEYNVKVIASNDSHYVDREDANAHDILLCINTGEKQSTPKLDDYTDEDALKKNARFAFPNDEFFFKTTSQMTQLFSDVPEAIDNTNEIVDKCDILKLKQDIMLPNFVIPQNFADQDEYLRHLTYEGARERYKEITPDVEERLNFELFTIKTMGFAGYFLIVSDFIKAGRDLGVLIGPGRGSAAGSAVAYCIGITNIDPIKYNLLFERFLNPDRKSMPDIDTDFDDEGRQKVIDYVVQKYGKNQVAQIITYGTMAAKMSIKDVARVMDLPLNDANALAKLVSDKPGIKLNRLLKAPLSGEGSLLEKESLPSEDIENAKELRAILDTKDDPRSAVLREALILEGSVRGTGIHAAGIIIAPKDLTEIIPVATAKDSDLLVTQYEGNVIEDAGVIKMDFLGLKTLTIIRDALALIEQNYGKKIEIDYIPLDDPKTYELYQRGDTNATFQFESAGMQKYLKELKPTKFDELIAMNALYRPGPLAYIPNFINRKWGREAVTYDLDAMSEYLHETYGICVYQEQIMLLSQKLANFTKGDADVLRKAMGKKQIAVLNKMKSQFLEGCAKNGHDTKIAEKVWVDWEAFASYAFNKSHSTCYAFVAYQTAYLKAHYPSEYMAAVLSNNQSNIDKITFFMEECRSMGVSVKGPDVNESDVKFSVNKKGDVRFALSAIKGVGEAAVEALIAERKANGVYKDIFDFIRRQNLRTVNKRVMEALTQSGAFDGFGIPRAAFFAPSDKYETFIEHLLKYGAGFQSQKASSVTSLFGEAASDSLMAAPSVPKVEEWNLIQKLNYEKDCVGIYLSGHPLDDFKLELAYATTTLDKVQDLKNQRVKIAAFVSSVNHRVSKKGTGFGSFVIQDYKGAHEFALFSEDYARFSPILQAGVSVLIDGEMKQKWNSDEYELKIKDVKQLASLGNSLTESITLMIPIEGITEGLIKELEQLCQKYKGKHKLKTHLLDATNKQTLHLYSTDKKVNVDSDFLAAVEAKGLSYKLN